MVSIFQEVIFASRLPFFKFQTSMVSVFGELCRFGCRPCAVIWLSAKYTVVVSQHLVVLRYDNLRIGIISPKTFTVHHQRRWCGCLRAIACRQEIKTIFSEKYRI